MRILFIGATSRTCKEFINLAIRKKHEIHAIVRDKSKLEGLKVELFIGSSYEPEVMEKAIQGCDAVVS